MSGDGAEPGLSEAELLRALGERTPPKPVSWSLVVALMVLAGGAMSLLVAATAHLTRRPTLRHEVAVDPQRMEQAVSAYRRADWDAAERSFAELRRHYPDSLRVQDYLDRIELTRRDAESLARAEEALVAGQPARARELAERVAANSPLFAQAEGLARSAGGRAANAAASPAVGLAPAPTLSVEVRAALGEALALYQDGRFADAASRAQALAARATGPAQSELSRWASDVQSFARLYAGLPQANASLLRAMPSLEQAIALDERIGDAHYARVLRARGAAALTERAQTLSQNGQLLDACIELVKARSLSPQERGQPNLARRCELEAARRVAQARALERKRPAEARAGVLMGRARAAARETGREGGGSARELNQDARALYEQARAFSVPGSPARRAAEQALSGP